MGLGLFPSQTNMLLILIIDCIDDRISLTELEFDGQFSTTDG